MESSAKYIEGLENRLGRMESLLKLSGLLGEEDDRTDLGTLEKRLADKALSNQNSSTGGTPMKSPGISDSISQDDMSESGQQTPQQDRRASTKSSATLPPAPPAAPPKKKEEEVEALSEMMCSLVTNGYGETRFIGIFTRKGSL